MMERIVIRQFITTVVLLTTSSTFAEENPLYNITGAWHVVATKGYNSILPVPKCWRIEISEISPDTFQLNSTFTDVNTGDLIVTHANATRTATRLSSDLIGRNEFQYFNLTLTLSSGQTIDIDSVTHWYAPGDPICAWMDMASQGNMIYWDKLFTSRSRDITRDKVPIADFFINNSNC